MSIITKVSRRKPISIFSILFTFAIWIVIFIAGIHIGKGLVANIENWQCIEYKLVPAQASDTDTPDFMSVCIVRKYMGEFPK